MTQPKMGIRAIRLILLGMMIGFAAYWAGARWGAHQATKVEALPISAKGEGNGSLTDEETINVRVYRAYYYASRRIRLLHGCGPGGRRGVGICD